jgi:ABC-type transporter Mla subunit MlaD
MGIESILLPREPAALGVVIVIGILFAIAVLQWAAAEMRLGSDRRDLRTIQEGPAADGFVADGRVFSQRAGLGFPLTDPDLAAALAERECAELEARMHWSRFIGSASVFLGLLGTVIGLGLVISTIDPQSSRLKDELSQALANMGSAFSCTLYGVLASVLLAAVVTGYQGRVERLCAERDRWLAAQAINRFAASGVDNPGDMGAVLKAAAQQLAGVLDPFVRTLDASSERIASASNDLSSGADAVCQLAEKLHAAQERVQALLDQLHQERRAADEEIREFREPLARLAEHTAAAAEAVQGVATGVPTGLAGLREEIGRLLEPWSREQEAASAARSAQLETMQGALAALREAAGDIRQLAQDESRGAAMETLLQRLDATSARLADLQSQAAQAAGQIPESIRHLANRFDQFTVTLTRDLTAGSDAAARQSRRLEETLASFSGLVDLVEGSLQDAPAARAQVRTLNGEADAVLAELRGAARTLGDAAAELKHGAARLAAEPPRRPMPPPGPPKPQPEPPPPPPLPWWRRRPGRNRK